MTHCFEPGELVKLNKEARDDIHGLPWFTVQLLDSQTLRVKEIAQSYSGLHPQCLIFEVKLPWGVKRIESFWAGWFIP